MQSLAIERRGGSTTTMHLRDSLCLLSSKTSAFDQKGRQSESWLELERGRKLYLRCIKCQLFDNDISCTEDKHS